MSRLGTTTMTAGARLLYRSGLFRAVAYLANRLQSRESSRFPPVERRRGGTLQILLYHRVAPKPDDYLPSLPAEVFRRHAACLARHFRVFSLSESLARLEEGTLPDNAVAITFDDGYRDNYRWAYPILREYGLPATVFLVTDFVGERRLLWHDRVFRAFGAVTGSRRSNTILPAVPGHGSQETLLANRARTRELERLRGLDPETRDREISRLEKKLDVLSSADEGALMLDWDEVREMRRGGIQFGSHTVSHPILSRIPEDRAWEEISFSRRNLEERLQEEITVFAYPNGGREDFGPREMELVRRAGYRWAVSTIFGTNGSEIRTSPEARWRLRRVGIDEPDPARFTVKMSLYRFSS